jgi:hypothetical protein
LQGPLFEKERPYRLIAGQPGSVIAGHRVGVIGSANQAVDATPYRGREFKLTAHVKTNVTGELNAGQCWAQVRKSGKPPGFFDNMDNRPIVSPSWGAFDIVGTIDGDADQIAFGCFLRGMGELWVDDVQLFFRNDAKDWVPIALKNPGFEIDPVGGPPSGWRAQSPGYTYQVRGEDPFGGQKSLRISSGPVSPKEYWPIEWSADGKSIFALDRTTNDVVAIPANQGLPTPHVRLTVPRGQVIGDITITRDGGRMVYALVESRSDVWIVENFDPSVR